MRIQVKPTTTPKVATVGIQGPSGPNQLGSATDLDTTNLEDGSVIVYNQNKSKFETTKTLEKQNLEGGHY